MAIHAIQRVFALGELSDGLVVIVQCVLLACLSVRQRSSSADRSCRGYDRRCIECREWQWKVYVCQLNDRQHNLFDVQMHHLLAAQH